MSFVFWPLLGGLALAGIPLVIHLLMRQKPKRLIFPALRFLQEGRKNTTRKLKLRHFLLLALRMLLIALLVFALARPYFNHPQLGLGGDVPVAAIMIIDTTPSMEFSVGGKTRLDDACNRARQLIDELPGGSRVAVLDTSEQLEEWSLTLPLARSKLDELRIVHAQSRARRPNGSVSRQIVAAYRMLGRLKDEEPEEKLTPLLVVFSDRTEACWDANELRDLKPPDHLGAVFVDVGVDKARDLAITELTVANDHRVAQQAFLPGQWIYFGVTVEAAAGADADKPTEAELHFRLASDKQPDIQSVTLRPGNRQVLWFKRRAGLKPAVGEEIKGLDPGQYQAEAQLVPGDDLPFNDSRFATFQVRDSRPVLVIADTAADTIVWKFDAEWFKLFRCEVQEVDKVRNWDKDKFDKYAAICLVNATNPSATRLLSRLADWVEHGGGLVVVPGGEGWNPDLQGYSDDDARKLLPGTFASDEPVKVPADKPGIMWEKSFRHPMLKLLRDWQSDDQLIFQIEGQEPKVSRYWATKPLQDENVIVRYQDSAKTPAILERIVGQGRVLMLTTSFDGKREATSQLGWTNYNSVYFSPILEALVLQYLAGETEDHSFNYLPGQTIPLTFPADSKELTFTLFGPGLANAEHAIQRSSVKQTTTEIDQAVTPGNYFVLEKDADGRTRTFGAFSINADPHESKLNRVETAEVEKALGRGSVVPLKYSDDLLKVLNERWPEPVELLPYIMILVLIFLAVENLFSNLFYRREDRAIGDKPDKEVTKPEPQSAQQALEAAPR
jgi:hypothetical protein